MENKIQLPSRCKNPRPHPFWQKKRKQHQTCSYPKFEFKIGLIAILTP